ncbi:MAG: DUF4358 domain-containing protein [Acutalibacteraceae bacterium]
METIKKALLFVLSITIIATLFGCSAQNDTTDIDIGYLSNELLEKAEFEDELNAIDDTTIKKLYNIDDYVKASVYLSSGATAEEIAVFEFDSKDTAADGLKKAQVRIEEQKTDFESYIPKEIPKLDRAVVKQSGKYVIVCVSNSNTAEKIITQYISGQNEE